MKNKKFLAVVLAALTAICISLSLAGCANNVDGWVVNISETPAETPCYYFSYSDKPITAWFKQRDFINDTISYYDNEFKKTNKQSVFLLNPETAAKGCYCLMNQSITFAAEEIDEVSNELINLLVDEYFTVHDPVLGDNLPYEDPPVYGRCPCAVKLSFVSAPVQGRIKSKRITLEFGNRDAEDDRVIKKYINIICGKICVATCYTDEQVEIPKEWYVDYFSRNLLYRS